MLTFNVLIAHARARVLAAHTSAHRAAEFEQYAAEALQAAHAG